MRVLVVDNYDSFTYNLVHLLGELGVESEVLRNDDPTLLKEPFGFQAIVISPGPSRPEKAGFTLKVIERNFQKLPIIGICLGHQAIGVFFGGKVKRAKRILHGKTSPIFHLGKGIFKGVPSPFSACRYHSLVLDEVPSELEIIAWDELGEIMGIAHTKYPIFGLQFHPEAYLSEYGTKILENFLKISQGEKP
jgi:anthranilate synthase/aminodeoxychorismate synthase-like glutamine amidotransferase